MLQKLRQELRKQMAATTDKFFSTAKEEDNMYSAMLTGMFHGFNIVEGIIDELEKEEN